jgi:DNA polymerase-3 subunit delta'
VSRAELQLPAALADATEHQRRARVALAAALAGEPSHAYLFRGPRGSGKAAAARAFAAEILAAGAEDPDDVRRRALLDPSPHPDLVWLAPRGAQHLVEEVREQVIRAAALRPFEGAQRVFVIAAAELLRDESQNALLKTLEEPPRFVHLLLLSSEPEALLETVVSRCQPVEFEPLPVAAVEALLAAEAGAGEDQAAAAAARLAAGDVERGRFLLSEPGRALREQAIGCVSAALAGEADSGPWQELLDGAEAVGEEAAATARSALEAEVEAGVRRSAREIADEAKRSGRRHRTDALDLGLELCGAWIRDLGAIAAGAADVVFNRDRLADLERQARSIDVGRARAGVELVQDTRRRLDLNVSEELALEALVYRLERLFAG